MDGGLGDLAGILKPMIAAMIKEILQQLLGGEGLKGMITGLLVGRQSGTSAAGPGRWNKRAGKGQPGPPDDADGVPVKGKGKGKGKKGGGDGLPKDKGKHNEAGSKGQGKSKDPAGDAAEWTVVNRRGGGEWLLRAGDWTDPVLDYGELVRLATDATSIVRAVALVSEEQRDTLTFDISVPGEWQGSRLAACGTPTVRQASERCAGAIGGRLTFRRQVVFTRACSVGVDPPGPKAQAAGYKVEIQKTSVIFVRFVQRYMDKEAWNQALKLPQKAPEVRAKIAVGARGTANSH